MLADSGLPGWVMLLISLVAAIVVCSALNYLIEKIAYRRCATRRGWRR